MHAFLKAIKCLEVDNDQAKNQNAERYRKIIRDFLYNIPNEETSGFYKVDELINVTEILREDSEFIKLLLYVLMSDKELKDA